MNKIICDVCGTSYPESANQCPICGSARIDGQALNNDINDSNAGYTYVKGGRFSTRNVKKRNRNKQHVPVSNRRQRMTNKADNLEKGLVITAITLLLIIIAVVIYIVLRFFMPIAEKPNADNTTTTATQGIDEPTGTPGGTTDPFMTTVPVHISCTELKVDDSVIEFTKPGSAWLLSVTALPANTDDVVTYSSSDTKVATVSSEGRVTAVDAGQATITITCGDKVKECRVVCDFEPQQTTSPTTEPTTQPTTPNDTFKLNRSDFTLANKGDTWTLYNGSVPMSDITWSSDDSTIVTVKDGKVTAVGSGYTTVRAKYDGKEYKCIVRCSFADNNAGSGGIAGSGGVSEDGGQGSSGATYTMIPEARDVTIGVGESFTVKLYDANKNTVNVNWTVANNSVASVNGTKVTGIASGTTTVSASYNGNTYSCIVRVK